MASRQNHSRSCRSGPYDRSNSKEEPVKKARFNCLVIEPNGNFRFQYVKTLSDLQRLVDGSIESLVFDFDLLKQNLGEKIWAYVNDEGFPKDLPRNCLAEFVIVALGGMQTWIPGIGLCGVCVITGEETNSAPKAFRQKTIQTLDSLCKKDWWNDE